MLPALSLAALAALAALGTLAGCDGGISGTGVPPVEANGTGGPGDPGDPGDPGGQAAPSSGTDEIGQPSPDTSPPDNGDADAVPDGASAQTLVNVRAVRAGAPGVRVVNLSGESLVVSDGAADGTTVPVAPLEASGTADGTAGGTAIAVELSAPQAPLRVVAAVDATPLAIFDPLALVDGSVTTLLVGPGATARTTVIALETEVAPSDPTLARVRIVTILADAAAGAVDELVLRGEGTDRQLGATDAARSASDYLPVPPGEYRVSGADGTVFDGSLMLEAGDVVTGILVAPASVEAPGEGAPDGGTVPRLLTLVDGRAAR